MEKGLDYVFNERTRMIIMGTFPSIKSRDVCYYNNPKNQFWRIIADIFIIMPLLAAIEMRGMSVYWTTALVCGMLFGAADLKSGQVWTVKSKRAVLFIMIFGRCNKSVRS